MTLSCTASSQGRESRVLPPTLLAVVAFDDGGVEGGDDGEEEEEEADDGEEEERWMGSKILFSDDLRERIGSRRGGCESPEALETDFLLLCFE